MKIDLIATLLCLTMMWTATARGQPPTSFHIASTHVNGVQRYPSEDVIRLSGLHVGSTVTPAGILTSLGVAGRVGGTPFTDTVRHSTKYVFSVHDPSPTTCAIHVRGRRRYPSLT